MQLYAILKVLNFSKILGFDTPLPKDGGILMTVGTARLSSTICHSNKRLLRQNMVIAIPNNIAHP